MNDFLDILGMLVMVLNFVIIVGLVALLLSIPFMLLWNWLMPSVFNLPSITFIQAIGLMILTSLIFSHGGRRK